MDAPPKKTLDRQRTKKTAIKIGGGAPIGAVLLLGGALATAAFVSSFMKRRKGNDRGQNPRLESSPSVKEIEVDDGGAVCAEEARTEINGGIIVAEAKAEAIIVVDKEFDENKVCEGNNSETKIEFIKDDVKGEDVVNGEEKKGFEDEVHEDRVDESVKEVEEETKIELIEEDDDDDDDDEKSEEVVENIEREDGDEKEAVEDEVVEKESHEDHVDEPVKEDDKEEKHIGEEVDRGKKGISCNELPLLKQDISCGDIIQVAEESDDANTSKEIEQDSILPNKEDLEITEVNENNSFVVCQEELNHGVETRYDHDDGVSDHVLTSVETIANLNNNTSHDQTSDCNNEEGSVEKLYSFEESLQPMFVQEVEGKVQEDVVIKETRNGTRKEYYYNFKNKYAKTPSRRAVAIGAFSMVSSISCSWFFGLSFVKLCVVLFLTMAMSKIHGY